MKEHLPFAIWFSILCLACALAAFMAVHLTVGDIPYENLA